MISRSDVWPRKLLKTKGEKRGAGERTRTADLLITNQLLYQLSYAGMCAGNADLRGHQEA